MGNKLQGKNALARLLGVKRRLDRGFNQARPPADGTASDALPLDRTAAEYSPEINPPRKALCINCGYDQQGVRLARCPECGLPLAAFYRDPTSWGSSRASFSAWWATAVEVWTCQRRLCVRASMMPATPDARVFSRWSALATAVMLSLTLAIADSLTPTPGGFAPLAFALRFVWAAVAISLLLFGTLYGLAWSLRGTWRHRYPFIPGSVHYATAWWPLVASLLLAFTALYAYVPGPDLLMLIGFIGIVGPLVWGLWLWASLIAAERVTLPSVRIGAAVLAVGILGSFVVALVPSATQWTLGQFVATQGGLAKVQVLNSMQTGIRSSAPQTYAVIIDVFGGARDRRVSRIATRLGAAREQQVCMYGDEAKIENIRKTLNTMLSEIRPNDRLLLYVAGHGMQQGAGAIRVNGGFVTSQMIADFVRDVKTPNNLVVIDSCFGGKFIKALRQQHASAVVLTSTDQQNVSFLPILRPFWNAWQRADADMNGDGEITVAEAFEAAFPEMLKAGERGREYHVNNGDKRDVMLMKEAGECTPQCEVLGKADEKMFSIPVDGGGEGDGNSSSPR